MGKVAVLVYVMRIMVPWFVIKLKILICNTKKFRVYRVRLNLANTDK